MKITSYISNLPRLFETWLAAYLVSTVLNYISLNLVVKSQTTYVTNNPVKKSDSRSTIFKTISKGTKEDEHCLYS